MIQRPLDRPYELLLRALMNRKTLNSPSFSSGNNSCSYSIPSPHPTPRKKTRSDVSLARSKKNQKRERGGDETSNVSSDSGVRLLSRSLEVIPLRPQPTSLKSALSPPQKKAALREEKGREGEKTHKETILPTNPRVPHPHLIIALSPTAEGNVLIHLHLLHPHVLFQQGLDVCYPSFLEAVSPPLGREEGEGRGEKGRTTRPSVLPPVGFPVLPVPLDDDPMALVVRVCRPQRTLYNRTIF